MESGQLISWEYIHHFNSRSRARRAKHGTFLRYVKHRKGYSGKPKACVKFHGNKGISKVPVSELKPMHHRRQALIDAQKDIRDNF